MAITHENTQVPVHPLCGVKNAVWLTTPLRLVINDPKRILRGLVREGDTVVDLGCGPGFFSLLLAQLVGHTGRLLAVDVQEAMLDKVRVRAEKAGLASRLRLHLAQPDDIGIREPADFVLAFYMLHEVADKERLLRQVHDILKVGGRFLLVEPMVHVPRREYRQSVETAKEAGLIPVSTPRIRFSRAALFTRS